MTRNRFAHLLCRTTALPCAILLSCASPASGPGRVLEIETTEVTAPDVAVSPDGETIVFTMLGHLFTVPAAGGTATQLTEGLSYESDPVFSPDGARLAFVSDRDGTEGNVFVLDLATGESEQVSHEGWAARPVWSPGGDSLLYLLPTVRGRPCWGFARVQLHDLTDGGTAVLDASERVIRSVFFTPDGTPGWVVVETTQTGGMETKFETVSGASVPGTVSVLPGIADRVVADSAGRTFARMQAAGGAQKEAEIVEIESDAVRPISSTTARFCDFEQPLFGLARDRLYLGDRGGLWRVSPTDGSRERIAFTAQARIHVVPPVPAPTRRLETTLAEPPTILWPRLTPDGRTLVFGALGYLWKQPLDGSPAIRLTDPDAVARDPAISPDGRRLAYVVAAGGRRWMHVLDLESGLDHTVPYRDFPWDVTWAPAGDTLVYAARSSRDFGIAAVPIAGGERTVLAGAGTAYFSPRPHFSADGSTVFYRVDDPDTASLVAAAPDFSGEPRLLAKLPWYLTGTLVSPDGRWLAFRKNAELWVAPIPAEPRLVTETDGLLVSTAGGHHFGFAPAGATLLYADGGSVWKYDVESGERSEIPIRLDFEAEAAPPLILENVRVLDFDAGGFTDPTRVLVREGRIAEIGAAAGPATAGEIRTVDVEGRFAVPGFIDAHTHAEAPYLWVDTDHAASIAWGVTAGRDMGESLDWVTSLRQRAAATRTPVPYYVYPGRMLQGRPRTFGETSFQAADSASVIAAITRYHERGASFIKAYYSLPWPLQRAAAGYGRTLGLPVAAHGVERAEIIRGITHGFALQHTPHASRFHDDVLQALIANRIQWTPTTTVYGSMAGQFLEEPDAWLTDRVCRALPDVCTHWRDASRDSPFAELTAFGMTEMVANIRAVREAGGSTLSGSDNIYYPGLTLHMEMAMFARAGFTPLEILDIASRRTANAIGIGQDVGTLDAGRIADIVLLDADPLEDIANARAIWRVIRHGWVHDPEELLRGRD